MGKEKEERKAYTKKDYPFSVNEGGEVTGASTSHSTTIKVGDCTTVGSLSLIAGCLVLTAHK